MKNVLIIEHNPNSLEVINESNGVQEDKYTLGGTFTEFDVKNRNERIYTWEKFQPALDELNERITSMGVYGEYDHPDTFDTSLKNASHLVKEAFYNPEKNRVEGKIKLLDINYGKEAKSLVDSGSPIFVSSRAAGITEANGEVTLKKLFTYDIVADPGFSSASMHSLNESIGYPTNSNFQIYEMENESKINKLFEMNNDDLVTKKQMVEYSEYLVDTIKKTKLKINESIKQGKIEPKKLNELFEYYDNMMQEQSKISQYLDYLAEKIQFVVNENKELKESNSKLTETTDNLIKHNDYLAENLDKSIQFSDYLSENLNKSIEYSEYIAESVDSNIAYSEYIAENLDDSIAYNDYIAEQLDKSIGYTKMISEKLNESSNKLFENATEEDILFPAPVDAGIEEVEDDELVNIDDVALDVETEVEDDDANCRVVCDDDEENLEETPDLLDGEELEVETEVEGEFEEGLEELEEVVGESVETENNEEEVVEENVETENNEEVIEENVETENNEENVEENVETENNEEVIEESIESEDKEDCEDCNNEENVEENENEEEEVVVEEVETDLTTSIDKLIEEAKKREASETTEHNFLKFLNKNQVDAFYGLTQDEQESVVAHINEKGNYFTSTEVLTLMTEALKSQEESLEDSLVRLMPESVKDTWDKISESAKSSILNQARLHSNVQWNDNTIEHFWLTRKFPVIVESNRELIAKEDKLIQEDVLSDDAFNSIMERFSKI